jgi:hypothetical protein
MECRGAPVEAEFDFLHPGAPAWEIAVEAKHGTALLSEGGRRLVIDGVERVASPDEEYARVYRRFAALVRARASDVDLTPFGLVADAFLLAERRHALPFHF